MLFGASRRTRISVQWNRSASGSARELYEWNRAGAPRQGSAGENERDHDQRQAEPRPFIRRRCEQDEREHEPDQHRQHALQPPAREIDHDRDHEWRDVGRRE